MLPSASLGHNAGRPLPSEILNCLHIILWDRAAKHYEVWDSAGGFLSCYFHHLRSEGIHWAKVPNALKTAFLVKITISNVEDTEMGLTTFWWIDRRSIQKQIDFLVWFIAGDFVFQRLTVVFHTLDVRKYCCALTRKSTFQCHRNCSKLCGHDNLFSGQ